MTKSQRVLSDFASYTKYARFLGDRRESFTDVVQRNADMHARRYPELEDEIYRTFGTYVLNREVLPSMRNMQFAGKPVELNPARAYNCAYLPIDDPRAFSEIMFLLLGGSGVGYSVQSRHVDKLPTIKAPHGRTRYLIQDSAIGWADSVKRLIGAYLLGRPLPEFDYRDIRPQGTPLVTSGGKAPGPEPLEGALESIERLLKRKEVGSKLRPIEVLDIVGHIAGAVLSGGIRRSATIALFDVTDEEMLYAKSGTDWRERHPERQYANISAVLDRRRLTKEAFDLVFDAVRYSGTGEPGFFFTNDTDWGTNPCGEIALQPFGFCNLTEASIDGNISDPIFFERVRAASFIGTLQAGYTDFHYLRPEWRERAVADSLLGVSLTGIASGNYRSLDLNAGARIVREENERVAAKIGIRPAKRTTTVKPSGTASLVLGTSSGIHPYWSRFQIRRVEVSKSEPLYQYLLDNAPAFLEDSRSKPRTALFSIPLANPENGAYRDESALEALERIRLVQSNWITPGHVAGHNQHNVSATVSVRDHEWDDVKEWMWKYRETYAGITLIPFWGGEHPEAPNEAITEDEFNEMSSAFPELDFRNIEEFNDETNRQGELACAGGACEV